MKLPRKGSQSKDAGIIEQYGSGITRNIKTFVAEGHQPPKLENFQHGFRITVNSNVPEKRLLRILSLIEKTPTMTVAQLARIITVSEKTIKRDLESLKATGQITRHGPDKGGRWEVKSQKPIDQVTDKPIHRYTEQTGPCINEQR